MSEKLAKIINVKHETIQNYTINILLQNAGKFRILKVKLPISSSEPELNVYNARWHFSGVDLLSVETDTFSNDPHDVRLEGISSVPPWPQIGLNRHIVSTAQTSSGKAPTTVLSVRPRSPVCVMGPGQGLRPRHPAPWPAAACSRNFCHCVSGRQVRCTPR